MANDVFKNLSTAELSEGQVSTKESDFTAHGGPSTVTELERLSFEMVRLAEGGARAANTESLERLSRAADDAGLHVIAEAINNATGPTQAILRARWLVLLSQETRD